MRFRLEKVHFMPKVLAPGVLYVSEEYGAAAHLCACGCGAKVRTPLGPTEWTVIEDAGGPTLWPSVGNWQRPCRSHYVIENGLVHWAGQWSTRQILRGRAKEQKRREAYFASRMPESRLLRTFRWIKKLWG